MSSLHKLKAYFGMVPVDEYDEYDEYSPDYSEHDEYPAEYSRAAEVGQSQYPGARPDREPVGVGGGRERDRHFDSGSSRLAPSRLAPLTGGGGRRSSVGGGVRGALALDDSRDPRARNEAPRRDTNPFPDAGHPLATITTLHPRTYNEARTIGERYREGNPVIMNLTEMSDADAKRLVDFAAGLAFAMHGAIDKVTNKVFLLSPSDVDVSAEDRRRLAETGFFQ